MGVGKPLPDLLQQTRKTLGGEVLTVSRTAYRARLKSVTRAIPGESSDWPRSLHRGDELALCRYGVTKPGPTRFLSDPPVQLRSFPLVSGFVQRRLGSRCIG